MFGLACRHGAEGNKIRGELTELVDGMDLDVISGTDAAVLVREFSLIEKIAAAARTLAAARVAETSAWVGEGDRSAEDWLSRQTGTSVGAAARDLRTGKRVKDQAKTKAAMKQCSLSPEQAGAVAEAVAVDPAAEDKLLETAKRETFKNLQDQARRTRAAATDDAERASRHHRERSARVGTDADGAFCLSLRGPATDGARILALLKPLQEQAFRAARSTAAAAVNRDTYDNRTYDAIVTMLLANTATAARPAPAAEPAPTNSHPPANSTPTSPPAPDPTAAHEPSLFDAETPSGPAAQPGTSEAPARQASPSPSNSTESNSSASDPADAGPPDHGPPGSGPPRPDPPDQPDQPVSPPTRLPGGNNTKVIVRVDLDALLRGHTTVGETSEIAGLGPVPVSVVREMLNDAFLAVVVTKARDVISVAHHGRGLNVHQRTAIEAQDLRCSNIACNQSVGIQIDHRHPWAKDQITKLDNQDPLCGPCHRRKTHQGWHLEAGIGPRRFLPPAKAG